MNADGGWAFRFIGIVAVHDVNLPSTRLRLRIRSCMFRTSTALSPSALCVFLPSTQRRPLWGKPLRHRTAVSGPPGSLYESCGPYSQWCTTMVRLKKVPGPGLCRVLNAGPPDGCPCGRAAAKPKGRSKAMGSLTLAHRDASRAPSPLSELAT